MQREKQYFTIREISEKYGVEDYTLRYWESKIKYIRPLRLRGGHRRYTLADVNVILKTKELLAGGRTLEGAEKELATIYGRSKKASEALREKLLEEIFRDVTELKYDIENGKI